MMVEAEATEKTIELVAGGATAPTEEVVAQGLEAAKPFIKALCDAQAALAAKAAKPEAHFPRFLDYQDDVYAAVEAHAAEKLHGGPGHRRQGRARGRHRRAQGRGQGRAGRPVRGSREGGLRRLPRA